MEMRKSYIGWWTAAAWFFFGSCNALYAKAHARYSDMVPSSLITTTFILTCLFAFIGYRRWKEYQEYQEDRRIRNEFYKSNTVNSGNSADPTSAEKATEGWEENTLVDQEIQEITHHIAENGSRWGNVSGGLLQAILAANTPKFDPRTVLRRFKANTVDKYTEDTRMRPDRRKGFDVPGKRHKFRSRILIAIDCSGSMSDEDVERGCAIINKFVKHADVSYCFWDGVCGPFTQQKQKSTEFKLIGRGCTNPDCVLEAIKERKAKFDGLVFITDNGFCWERPEHMANKIFLIHTADACEPPEWIKYILSFKQLFSIED